MSISLLYHDWGLRGYLRPIRLVMILQAPNGQLSR